MVFYASLIVNRVAFRSLFLVIFFVQFQNETSDFLDVNLTSKTIDLLFRAGNMMDLANKTREKIKLVEINPHLTCSLCKGYYIDATTISECLHSFCRSCIIKFLHEHSYCPICEVIINKAKPNLKLDKTLQDIVYKLVPELFLNEMKRRQRFYENHPDLATKVTPEERGEDTERTIFNPRDTISLSIEYISDDSTPGAILIPQLHEKEVDCNEENSAIKRFLQCPGMCRIEVLKKFIRNKYNVDTNQYYIDILYKRVPLPDHYTLIDIAYIYSWKRNEPMKFFFKITDIKLVTDTFDYLIQPQIKAEKINAEKEYTNITLDRSSNVEIITKIQKVSNKNGLQIGIKITKQAVKKSPPKKELEVKTPVVDVDQEKSQFLKSFQLTAKTTIPPTPVKKAPKRKNPSPIKTEKAKKPKKVVQVQSNPAVQQILTNVNQNGPNLSKIVEGSNDLQALLFDSYKINIPSSLSVTVKNEKDDPTLTFQKPVQNYIEILKIPETQKETKPKEEVKIEETPKTPPPTNKVNAPPTNLVKLNPRTPQTFQKMFEEAIRKPEFNSKFQTVPIIKENTSPASKTPDNKRNILEIATKLYKKTKLEQEKKEKTKKKLQERPLKDFNSYISSKPPVSTPTTSPVQTVTSLHSPSLGLNYTVSVAQTAKPKVSPKLDIEIPSSSTNAKTPTQKQKSPSPVKKDSGSTGSKLNVNIVSSSATEDQPLSPNKLLEKYNIQNLAQLSANFNFPQDLLNSSNQLAALRQAMIYRHFEMQNHQNWLNMNPGPLMQYEKYLKSFSKS
ncbi:hypothetical protein RN001_010474 [Aquatica leii]|uniref:RING-type domain-containing protein n=1 Tax=Aquatica leii TaxID=1421715 RepID=A0AAN7QHH2_9COLE|nr:hypothetical protein RN001_010474 [Aquatica leii]